jgi:hypothetical protein
MCIQATVISVPTDKSRWPPPLPTKKEENAVSAASAPNSCWTAQGELWASGDMKTAPLSLEAISAIAVEERTLTYAA